jgi:MSHA biogenesis protein MshO
MRCRQQAFTLVELVITIALSLIVVSFMAQFMSVPVQGYADQARRARLVDLADNSLRRLTRDVRNALPNSLRVRVNGTVVALEMLAVEDGARYRDTPPPADTDNHLEFSVADTDFNTVGGFANIAKPFSSTSHYLSVYNVGVPGADAYELANVITPPGTSIDIAASGIGGEDRVQLLPAFQFSFASPDKRVFLVSGPVTWLCDTAGGTLHRYSGYAIASNQASRDSGPELMAAGALSAEVTRNISACNFTYTAGTAQRAGLLTAGLAISEAGETVTLLHQVHTDNVP